MSLTVDQRNSKVNRDQIAGDRVTNNYASPATPRSVIEVLLDRLNKEIENNLHAKSVVDKLLRYNGQVTSDGVIGLEAKLAHANRQHEVLAALEQKEQFAKLIERFSLYASAQEIIVHLLARAEYNFTHFVYPQLVQLNIIQVNDIINQNIVLPTVNDCGASVFAIDHGTAMGMIYWLAERCHVRWHQ